MRRFPAILPYVLLTLALSLFHAECRASGQSEAGRWIADLDLFAKELPERHINLFFNLPEDEFHLRVKNLQAQAVNLKDYEIAVGLMKIVASIGDSHTMLNTDQGGIFHKLPVILRWFSDGLYAVQTVPDYRGILGKRLTGIEGKSIEEVNTLVETVVSHENAGQLKIRGPKSMVIPEILAALDIAASIDSVGFDFEDIGTVTIKPVAGQVKLDWLTCLHDAECTPPLYLQHADSIYWYRYLENENMVYAQYRACSEHDEKPFAVFAGELFGFIDSHRVERLVFDMRSNGGGNSAIARPIIEGVAQRANINRRGHLFVVIGRDTYSSAILNALEFQNETQALFIGEATGGKPNHYGEVKFFLLPRTWIIVTYSTKYFTHSKRDTPSLEPDIEIDLTFSDYVSCRDPVLEAILKYE